jgi:hypothetical protein
MATAATTDNEQQHETETIVATATVTATTAVLGSVSEALRDTAMTMLLSAMAELKTDQVPVTVKEMNSRTLHASATITEPTEILATVLATITAPASMVMTVTATAATEAMAQAAVREMVLAIPTTLVTPTRMLGRPMPVAIPNSGGTSMTKVSRQDRELFALYA